MFLFAKNYFKITVISVIILFCICPAFAYIDFNSKPDTGDMYEFKDIEFNDRNNATDNEIYGVSGLTDHGSPLIELKMNNDINLTEKISDKSINDCSVKCINDFSDSKRSVSERKDFNINLSFKDIQELEIYRSSFLKTDLTDLLYKRDKYTLAAENSGNVDNSEEKPSETQDEEDTDDNNIEEDKESITGENPALPITRYEMRFKYQNQDNGTEGFSVTLRGDKVFRTENKWVLAIRADLPLMINNVSTDVTQPVGDYNFGSSDLLVQFAFIPPRKRTHFFYGFGIQAMFPIASDTQFGRGKFIVAPAFYFF
ncbi:MAG: hypothetical protein ABRQ39_04615 [Candidatus Eremiobacterota bacterium]